MEERNGSEIVMMMMMMIIIMIMMPSRDEVQIIILYFKYISVMDT